ncbi:MAG: DUF4012 domain-containing protein [Ilumatobacteraceae bacterium]
MTLIIGLLAGALVALSGASPTGTTWSDIFVILTGCAAVVWLGSSAPWWVLAIVAASATAFGDGPVALAAGVVALLGAFAVGLRRLPWWGPMVVVALLLQTLARLGDIRAFGVSAAVGVSLAIVVAVAGAIARPAGTRLAAWCVVAGGATFLVLASLGASVAGALASRSVSSGVDQAKLAVEQLNDGDFDAARTSFAAAAADLERADRSIAQPWAQAARVVPVVAQYRSAADELVHSTAVASRSVASALEQVDPDALRVRNGTIDVAAVDRLRAPLESMMVALNSLAASANAVDNPWLASALTDRLDQLTTEIDDKLPKGDRLVQAVSEMPNMLGAQGKRHYFIGFTTPSEVRGLGGFMGNWAEVTLDKGKIEVTKFGRHTDLNTTGAQPKRVTGPDDFLDTWGDRGFVRSDGTARENIWSDVTMSPNFPSVAQVVNELYPQSGGQQLDGVFVMDVYAVAALLQVTGPVEVPQANTTVSADNAAQFLLHDQYLQVQNQPDRVDALELVAKTTIERLLTTDLPSPQDIAKLMAPFVRDGRFVGWAKQPSEQALFETLGGDGALPEPGDHDAIALAFNNAGMNKIDYFLDAEVSYDVQAVDPTHARGEMTVTVRNGAPTSGEPPYVVANNRGNPESSSDLYVSIYGVLPIRSVTVNGVPQSFKASIEAGYGVASLFVVTPSNASSTVVVTMEGAVADAPAFVENVAWHAPPIVRDVRAQINGQTDL